MHVPSPDSDSTLSCKATLFQIFDHWFALPTTTILKIVPSSTLQDQSQLLVWDNQPLIQLNLHQLIHRVSSTSHYQATFNSSLYTLIIWSQTGDRCGIPIQQLPILQDLSLSKAQILPPHYRQSIGNIAKYLVIQPYQGKDQHILLLDLQQALNRTVHSTFSTSSSLIK